MKKTPEQKIKLISGHFAEIMKVLGLDLKDPSLKDTPKRVAKMYVNETLSSLHLPPPKITVFPNKKYDQMLIERDIVINSQCEHHFVPFVGKCHIAYLPGKNVIGLSKLIRIAQYHASKPQLQERLTTEIADHLEKALGTVNIAVVIDCKHFCCGMRGAKDPNASTITSHLGGIFKEPAVRSELFSLLKL